MFRYILLIILIALAVGAWLIFGLLRRAMFTRQVGRAREEFHRQQDAFETAFLQAVASSGKPRGLAWKKCELQNSLVLARDRANGELVGLVGVTISFEAIEGGGMEDVEAVGNLRAGTAVFTHNGERWTTHGRAVFNLEPLEVLERYGDSLEAI